MPALKMWTGTEWIFVGGGFSSAALSTVPPSDPVHGELWIDATETGGMVNIPLYTCIPMVTESVTVSNTVWIRYGQIFKFTASEFPSGVQFTVQVSAYTSGGDAFIRLYDLTSGSVVVNSVVTVTSSWLASKEGSAFTLVDSHEYRIEMENPTTTSTTCVAVNIIAKSLHVSALHFWDNNVSQWKPLA